MANAQPHLKQYTEPAILQSTGDAVAITTADFEAILKDANIDLAPADVVPLTASGISNTIYSLGHDYVLRVARNHPDAFRDAYTESVAVPAVTAQEIKTPHLITFSDSRRILPTPYTIYERIYSEPFIDHGDPVADAQIYRDFGAEIARLHQRVTECPDPNGLLDRPYRIDAEQLVQDLTVAGYLSTDNLVWLQTVFGRLLPAIQGAASFRRFLHGDAHPGNIMIRNNTFDCLLDWGDAGWGDPALEFTYIPSRAIPFAMEGYRSVMPMEGDDTAEARMLWDHLARALSRLKRAPAPTQQVWSDRPGGPLIELLAAAGAIEAWQHYLY